MAQDRPQKDPSRTRYEELDQMADRVGAIADRFNRRALDHDDRPDQQPVEHPQRTKETAVAREQQAAAQEREKTWLDGSSKPDFQRAAQGDGLTSTEVTRQSVESEQVKETGARNIMSAPDNSDAVDRQIHKYKMAADDARARSGRSDAYFERLKERSSEQSLDERINDRLNDHQLGQDQGRGYSR